MYNKEIIKAGKRNCPICDTEYDVRPWMVKNNRGFTCSRPCGNQWKSDHSDKKLTGNCIVENCNYIGPLDIGRYCFKHYQYRWTHGITEPKHLNSTPLKIPDKDAAWLAGIIDCDGWVGLMESKAINKRNKPAYWGVIGVGSVKRYFIDELIKRTKIGRRNLSKRKPPARNLYTWSISKRSDLDRLLLSIIPYLIIKRRQARLLLMLPPPNSRNRPRRERIQKLIKALNKKGHTNRSANW